jgi:hypothetical protein
MVGAYNSKRASLAYCMPRAYYNSTTLSDGSLSLFPGIGGSLPFPGTGGSFPSPRPCSLPIAVLTKWAGRAFVSGLTYDTLLRGNGTIRIHFPGVFVNLKAIVLVGNGITASLVDR